MPYHIGNACPDAFQFIGPLLRPWAIKGDRDVLNLTLRNSLYRPARTVLMVLAVAAVLAEILVLEGFLAGSYAQMRGAVLRRGGDVIVAQSGISNFLMARSILPQQTRAEVEARPGVVSAEPLTLLSLIYERDGRLTPIFILVYDTRGGPVEIVQGRAPEVGGEMVIDRSLSERYGLAPGDTLTLSDYDFTVSGVSQGSAVLFTPFAFMTYDSLLDFYFESDVAADIAAFPLLSFLSVDVAPGFDPATVAADIRTGVPDANALLIATLAKNDDNLGRELLGPVLNLLLWLSYVIGAMAIGMFMFGAVRSRRKALGVMRALGFTTRHLAQAVIGEAVVLVLLAIPVAIGLAIMLAWVIQTYAPVYLVLVTEPAGLWRTGIIALVLAVLGGLAPLRMLSRLDPATAFRG
jgi:FtsX-like permease family protein/MacB-like protein